MKTALFALLLATTLQAQTPITFPKDGGVLDVTSFGAKGNDNGDDTVAIQKALDAFPNGNRIVYLPQGTWIVTDTLRWPKGEGGNGEKRTILQGAGMALTKIVVPPSTPGFGDKPKVVLWTGLKPAQRFRNAVRDLTIEIGAGNPQAIGMQFNASNQGTIRNVTLRAAKDSGLIGLDMGFTDEIGPLLVRNLTVEGFETGIVTKWPVNSNTFEHITLRGQRKLGWHNYHQMIFVLVFEMMGELLQRHAQPIAELGADWQCGIGFAALDFADVFAADASLTSQTILREACCFAELL